MVRAFLAFSLLSASAAGFAAGSISPKLAAAEPWWEKVTVTVPPAGSNTSCTFTSSSASAPEQCDVANQNLIADDERGGTDELTTITFERRFAPGVTEPDNQQLAAGETLLGGQVLKLAIDGSGRVSGCSVVAKAGDMEPDYGCQDASAEKFAASASRTGKTGFMTVLVYAHKEALT